MIGQVKAAERLVLAVAAPLLPALVAWGALTADQATSAGAVVAALSAGLRLPAAAQAVTARRSPRRQHQADDQYRQLLQRARSAMPATAPDTERTAELEAQLTQALGRLAARLGDTPPAGDGHGDRPAN